MVLVEIVWFCALEWSWADNSSEYSLTGIDINIIDSIKLIYVSNSLLTKKMLLNDINVKTAFVLVFRTDVWKCYVRRVIITYKTSTRIKFVPKEESWTNYAYVSVHLDYEVIFLLFTEIMWVLSINKERPKWGFLFSLSLFIWYLGKLVKKLN